MDKNRLLTLAEHVGNMGHWGWDIASDALTLSEQVMHIIGVGHDTCPATVTEMLERCHPDDVADVKRRLDDAVENGTGFEFDVRVLRADGGVRTLIVKGQPEFDGARRLIAMYGVATDVTEAFAAIHSLHDRTEMLALAAALAHLGHWVWTRDDGRLSFCSDEMARLHGLTPQQFLGRYAAPDLLAGAVAPENRERYREALARAIADAAPYETEYRIVTPNGLERHIREIGQPIFSESGKLVRFIATAQDITEAKRRETELQRTAEELERKTAELQDLNRQKDKLFSIIAHDLRSPFNSVIGFADLLAAKARELSPGKVASYAQMVRESATGVHELLDNLLAWASYQIRDAALQPSALDLGQAAAESIEPLVHMAEAKGITIANSIKGVRALGDEALVRIVIRNLVSNGIKFSRHGGLVQISARPVTENGAAMIEITVRDDGVGIPANAAANLFDLGRTVSSPGTRGEKGTGLGLYLCHDIIARHGGRMSVESKCGAGAAFHFTLPAAGP